MRDTRVIIFHKHPVSAKVRFLKFAYGGICGFEPLPQLAEILNDELFEDEDKVVTHPVVIARQAEKALGIKDGLLDIASEYLQRVDVPNGVISVYLLGLLDHDTPDETLLKQGASLRLITEIGSLPTAEMELLRRAYVAIMEG